MMTDNEEPDEGLFEDLVGQLANYAKLDNSESGEYAEALVNLYTVAHYGAEEQFFDALCNEIREMLSMYHAQATIVEQTVTREDTYQELVWNEEVM